MNLPFSGVPAAQGLYDPQFEHDACGVAFVADLHGRASHRIVEQALTALHNLDHRGAAGAEPVFQLGADVEVDDSTAEDLDLAFGREHGAGRLYRF